MSALEQPFLDAIAAKEIEGVIVQGADTFGSRYSKALGSRTLLDGTTKALSTSDILFLASATKFLTAIAALHCCERGLLDLDADLSSQLPMLVDQGVISRYDGESPVFEPLRKPPTLRHLLTHSSGLVYDMFQPEVAGAVPQWRAANPPPKGSWDVPARYTQPLAFQPGESWMYGPGIDWAGYIVEKATRTQLDEYFRTYLLLPLGISSTELSFFPLKEGLGDRMPDLNPSDPHGAGLVAGMGHSVHGPDGVAACFGGQGAYMTSEAYLAVLQSILHNDGNLLRPETVRSMFEPQLEPLARQGLSEKLEGSLGLFFGQGTSGKDCDFGLGGLLVGRDEPDAGFGKGTMTWAGGINTIWHIDRVNSICGFASQQAGLPVNIKKVMELKGVFRRELKGQLEASTSS